MKDDTLLRKLEVLSPLLLSEMHNSQFEFQPVSEIIDTIACSSKSVRLLVGMTIEIRGFIVKCEPPSQNKAQHINCQQSLN